MPQSAASVSEFQSNVTLGDCDESAREVGKYDWAFPQGPGALLARMHPHAVNAIMRCEPPEKGRCRGQRPFRVAMNATEMAHPART